MRTVKLLPSSIAKETDLTKFPDSTVVNETETNEGTPVIREIYGDVLTNIYRVLRFTKTTANGDEDNETNGYQFFDALRKLTNTLNDAEQQLSLNGLVFSVDIDLSILPNKYICIARSVEDYVTTENYQFKGNGASLLPFTSPVPFVSGDVVLLIIDTAGVRAYSLVPKEQEEVINELYTPFGTPVAFNNASKMYYQEEGALMTDTPEVYDLQAFIRFSASDGTLLVYEMLVVSGYVYCLVFAPTPQSYFIYRSSLTDLNNPTLVTMVGGSFPTGVDNKPNLYTDGEVLLISNESGNSATNGILDVYSFNHATGVITKTSTATVTDFTKSTNAVVKNNAIYDLVNGQLNKYNLSTGSKTLLASYPGYLGVLFGYKASVYFTTGEVAKLWNLPN